MLAIISPEGTFSANAGFLPPAGADNDSVDILKSRDDEILARLYHAEMEKRCSEGVWWEGWMIVEDLKRQGMIGSVINTM